VSEAEKPKRYFQGCHAPWFLFKMMDEGDITPVEMTLYLIVNSYQEHGYQCWLSNAGLGQRVGLQKRMTQLLIAHMVELGLVASTVVGEGKETTRYLTVRNPFQDNPPRAIHCAPPRNTLHGGSATHCARMNVMNGENTVSPQAGTARKTLHPRWLRYAQTLGNTIALSRKVKHTPAQIRAWAKWISKLESQKGIDHKRIKAILKWYCTNLPANLDNRYYPVVRCGESFFSKFDKLEDAKHRMELEAAEANGEELPDHATGPGRSYCEGEASPDDVDFD
jgi:hypothetical protein